MTPESEPGAGPPAGGAAPSPAGKSRNSSATLRAPVLTPEQARLWLGSVTEEPGRALQQAARRASGIGNPGSTAGSPAW